MGAVVRSEAEIRREFVLWDERAEDGDQWSAAWAEALEWVLS